MELSLEKKPKFDAFGGNALQKPSSNTFGGSRRQIYGSRTSSSAMMKSSTVTGGAEQLFNFDQMWRGSISNLKSSENITADLIKESIKDLEAAMGESKRMLMERDNEIAHLREFIDNNKLKGGRAADEIDEQEDEERHVELVNELKETQKQNTLLERQMHELTLQHSSEISNMKNAHRAPPIWHMEEPVGTRPECTCYCGTVCKALKDLVETRQNLETTKIKYENLKRRVKEFRKQAEVEQQHKALRSLSSDGERMSSCTIQ